MPESTLKRFTVSLDAGDYEALCALAQTQRPLLSPQLRCVSPSDAFL